MMEQDIKESFEEKDEYWVEHTIQVDKGQEPIRLDKFIMGRIHISSRNRLQNAIKASCLTINGKIIDKVNHRVKPYDNIKFVLPKDTDPNAFLLAEDIPLSVVYEDKDLMVINKKSGMVVHPGIGNSSGTLVNALLYYINKDLPILPGNSMDRPGLVHRLDKDTSGLVVIAKSDYAMTHLAKQFFDHSIERTYHSLVWGTFDEQQGTVDVNIGRHPTDKMKMYAFEDNDLGKKAITHYKVINDMYYVSEIECKLETGRTHQIRVHMNFLGHPVFNDQRYGGDRVVKGTIYTKYKQYVQNCFTLCPRQALHAKTIGFIHPTTQQWMKFDSELPQDMQNLIDKWSQYMNTKSITKDSYISEQE